MRAAEEIKTSAKPMFDRFGDGLKVLGAGNTAGLVGMVAALNTIKEEHVHTVLLLKPTAVIFAIGVFLFAGAYLLHMYAYIYTEHYVALLYPNDDKAIPDDPKRLALANGARDASTTFMKRAFALALASTFLFFLGFVTAFVALVRY